MALLTTLVASAALALPSAAADLGGEGQRYVGFRNAQNACGDALRDEALIGGVCFKADSSHAAKRIRITVADDFGQNTYAYYEMTSHTGRLLAIGHFCGSVLTQLVPGGTAKISVSVYPGVYLERCPGSAGTGVSGTIFAGVEG